MFGCGSFEFGADEVLECYDSSLVLIGDIEEEVGDGCCEADCDLERIWRGGVEEGCHLEFVEVLDLITSSPLERCLCDQRSHAGPVDTEINELSQMQSEV
jgi:hypothetical protein